jgi:hypothetical protein
MQRWTVAAIAWIGVAGGAAGCRRSPAADPAVTADIERYLDALPPPAPGECTDRDRAAQRLTEVLPLLREAYDARTKWDDPLPPDLLARAREVDLDAAADDLACLARDPRSGPAAPIALGAFAALLVDRGTASYAAGEIETGFRDLLAALRVFAGQPARNYLHRFSAFWVFGRIADLSDGHPPADAEARARLAEAVDAARMDRESFCAGFGEEFLAHTLSLFPTHARPLRERVVARYAPLAPGPEDFPNVVFGDRWATDYSGRPVWPAYRALFDPLLEECATGDPRALWESARSRLETLLAAAPGLEPLRLTVGRFRDYADLLDAAARVPR